MTARKSHAEPYAFATRRKRLFRSDAFQLYVPSTNGAYEFNSLNDLTRFIERHLPGKSVRWDI